MCRCKFAENSAQTLWVFSSFPELQKKICHMNKLKILIQLTDMRNVQGTWPDFNYVGHRSDGISYFQKDCFSAHDLILKKLDLPYDFVIGVSFGEYGMICYQCYCAVTTASTVQLFD